MSEAKSKSSGRYMTVVEILANAHFTEDPERMQLKQLSLAIRARIATSRLSGCRPIRVTWPDGATAVIPIPPGAALPPTREIVRAYQLARGTTATWPKGVLS